MLYGSRDSFGLPFDTSHRTTYVDRLPELFAEAETEGWQIFYLGGTPESVVLAEKKIRGRYPQLKIEMRDGFFNIQADTPGILAHIRASGTQVLLVGMGMPRQEVWLWENREELGGVVQLTAGGALAYYDGSLRVAPRWVGRAGLEWLYRLCLEPRRLMFRYLAEPWLLLIMLLQKRMKKAWQEASNWERKSPILRYWSRSVQRSTWRVPSMRKRSV